MIYFDNNATTLVPQDVIKEAMKWVNVGNPSADHAGGKAARLMMQHFREYIGNTFGVDPCCRPRKEVAVALPLRADPVMNAATHVVPGWHAEDPNRYKIIFCSGASEGNAMVVQSIVASAKRYRGGVPHVVASAVEHKSILAMLEILSARGDITYSLVRPQVTGHILAEDVAAVLRPETCLACIMHANNETGAINPIEDISRVCHARNIPLHCDMVQTAGRIPPRIEELGIDSAVMSFHKFHGFPGAGAVILKQQLILGYHLEPIIPGSQNDGLRGGTENIIGIAAGYAALKQAMVGRPAKNAKILQHKQRILLGLSKQFRLRGYASYLAAPGSGVEIVIISPPENCLVNTILLSVVKRSNPRVCNQKIKQALEAEGCIISVGSACNTAAASASHVLYAMDADEFVRAGTLRISLGDATTAAEVDRFVKLFTRVVGIHLDGLGAKN
jgi:cysteine desulfurase